MDLSFFPKEILSGLKNVNMDKLYEIRLRLGQPIKICYKDGYCYLSKNGATMHKGLSIVCEKNHVEETLLNVTEHSIYAFNDKISRGYITLNNGIRIGLAGECVCEKDCVVTIKNFTSLNVRIPQMISGCADDIFNYIFSNFSIKNTLIISPAFYGKTTILKDVAIKMDKLNLYNVLIIDERGEFNCLSGENIDVIKFSSKNFGFTSGLRSLSPQIIITDELVDKTDWNFVKLAVNSGVKVVASCHGDDIFSIANKKCFIDNLFDCYIVLTDYGYKSNVFKVYDKNKVEL